ncbi:MAG: response regulator [Myxococcales bacterium]
MTRVLIVEDDPAQARALARSFAKQRPDLTVLTSSNGLEATRLMTERAVDLVLTDLQMPEMDGFELVAWTVSHCPDAAVFTMSAYGAEDTAARINGLGAIEYFSKPIDPKAVLDRLTDALNQSVRGHVQNVSLASFLQLMEMERKTCNLTIKCDDKSGLLVVRKGELVDARSGDLQGEDAAISIIAWPNPSIMISRHSEVGPAVIQKSLGFIVMEAMRVQDEAAHNAPKPSDGNGSSWPAQRHSWRPSPMPPPPSSPLSAAPPLVPSAIVGLPSGATAIAVVDTATGAVLKSAAKDGVPLVELAGMAALVLRHQTTTLSLCNVAEGVEELVLSTTQRCDVIRPLNGSGSQFALLVFEPEETNLVMARLELDRFIAGHR